MKGFSKIFKRNFNLCLVLVISFQSLAQEQNKASIKVDFSETIGEMQPIYRWVGYDEPNYTYMKDGKKLLSQLAELSPEPVFVRAHSLLNTGDGTPAIKWGSTNAYTEDEDGNPIYNWKIVDSIFDTYVDRGMKPLAQIGFMPEALTSHKGPYRHYWKPGDPYENIYTGWSYPPSDYEKWEELIYQWVTHCVERYGKAEVESWYWEVWNEPDIPYWQGTWEEYFKLYDYAAHGLKRALPTARIGGPDSTGGAMKFLDAFIQHCLTGTNYATGETGAPLEIILFHAKGFPRIEDSTVVMNAGTQLRNIEDNFNIIAKYPELKDVPVVIGESDPEGCAACGMDVYPQNAYRNGTMYSSYTAATFARKYALAKKYDVNLIGAVSWSFEFENSPWFHGFRSLATNGIEKPVLNVFRMFGKMGGDLVYAESDKMYNLDSIVEESVRKQYSDVGVLASKGSNSSAIMIWNYHDREDKNESYKVELEMNGLPAEKVLLKHYRIDDENSNSYEVWKKMGSPQNPTKSQIDKLESSAGLKLLDEPKMINNRQNLNFELPFQGVSLLLLEY